MYNFLPEKLKNLANICDFNLYVVGGSVRNFLADLKESRFDLDICAPVTLDRILPFALEAGLSYTAVYKNTGAVKFYDKDTCQTYEFTSFRSDKYIRGEHTPQETFFTDDIKKDAVRRDFTCNAVYYDIKNKKFIDLLGGMDDIKNKTLKTVREADKVFSEDGLRLMRLARFCAELGFSPDDNCLQGAKNNCELIRDISAERVFSELNLILQADGKFKNNGNYNHYYGLEMLKEIGVLKIIFPELCLGENMPQRKDFHNYDVLEHSLRSCKYSDKSIRLCALLHDVGKPYCYIETGKYHGHQVSGRDIARVILNRLKAPKDLTEEICKLVYLHMADLDLKTSTNKVKWLMVENYDILPKLLLLKQADFSGCKDDLSTCPTNLKWLSILDEMKKENLPFSVKDLVLKGNEIIDLGVEPKYISEILTSLLKLCVFKTCKNEKQELIKNTLNLYKELKGENA